MRNPIPSSFIVHPSLTFGRRPSFFIFHCSLFILLSLFILHSSFFITGCSSSTKPKTGSLSGRVILVNDTGDPTLDPVDFSGVTVALYKLAELDTTIVRINQEYPQIGVQISQETEFDHRLQNPVKVVTTESDGNYRFDRVALGSYNLVAMKQGWGYFYIYNIQLAEKSDPIDVDLFPDRAVATVNSSAFTFVSGRHYVVENSSIFLEPVEIQTGSTIRIAPGESISFHGPITVSEVGSQRFRFTTDNHVYSSNKADSLETYDRILFASATKNYIHSGLVQAIQNGLQFQNGSAEISNTVFSGGGVSFVGSYLQSTVQRCLIRGYNQIAQNFYGPTTISRNIYYNNTNKCMILYELEGSVSDNYFVNNWIGVQPHMGTLSISHNCFDGNAKAISVSASGPYVEYNNFYSNAYDLEYNAYLIQTGVTAYCQPRASNNNFYAKSKSINIMGHSGIYIWINIPIGIDSPMQFQYNYWGVSDPSQLVTTSTSYPFNYIPRNISPITSAGIR